MPQHNQQFKEDNMCILSLSVNGAKVATLKLISVPHLTLGGLDLSLDLPRWPLTLKFDKETRQFIKIDMPHGAYRHKKKYYGHDISNSLNSTCDIMPF